MPDNETTLTELKDLVNQFIAERDWFKYHDAKNLSMSIAIEAAELLEHFQWVRSDELDSVTAEPATRQQIEDELSDIFSFLLSFANRLNIDMSEALKRKMAKNAIKYPAELYRGKYRV
jgi:dCTP diphosphatase